ncbi:MAG: hypothetical protein ABIJ91_02125, partial [Candidatus Kuenenbacteria bacterium]
MTKTKFIKFFLIALVITIIGFSPFLEFKLHECEPVINPGGPTDPYCYTMPLGFITLPGFITMLAYDRYTSHSGTIQTAIVGIFLWVSITLITYLILIYLIYSIRKRLQARKNK